MKTLSIMKQTLLLFGVLFFLYSCEKSKEAVIEEGSVESFSEVHFKRYDSDLSGDNFILNEDSSFIIVGHGRNPIARSPSMLKLDSQYEMSWLRHFEGDRSYSAIDIVQTMDGGFMLLSSFNPPGSGKRDNYLIKTSQEGDEWWNKKIGDPAIIEIGNSIVQLPNAEHKPRGQYMLTPAGFEVTKPAVRQYKAGRQAGNLRPLLALDLLNPYLCPHYAATLGHTVCNLDA